MHLVLMVIPIQLLAIAGAIAGAYYGKLSDTVNDIVFEKLSGELRDKLFKCD